MAKRIAEEEKVRLSKQKEALGKDGLEEAERELEAAKKEHEKEIPGKILNDFPVPDVKSIAWIPLKSLQEVGSGRHKTVDQCDNEELQRHIQSDGPPLPFFVQYDHVEVCISVDCTLAYWLLTGYLDELRYR